MKKKLDKSKKYGKIKMVREDLDKILNSYEKLKEYAGQLGGCRLNDLVSTFKKKLSSLIQFQKPLFSQSEQKGTTMTLRQLKEAGFSSSERTRAFLIKHPELVSFTPHLLGTYTTCQAGKVKPGDIELDEAYEHIFGGGKNKECKWCQEHLKNQIEMQREFYK